MRLALLTLLASTCAGPERFVTRAGADDFFAPQLRELVDDDMPSLQRCYRKRLQEKPGLKGLLDTAFIVDTSGRVVDVLVLADPPVDPVLAQCVRLRMMGWIFDPPPPKKTQERFRWHFEP